MDISWSVIKPGELWRGDYLFGRAIGPVFTSAEIGSMCEIGQVIRLDPGRTDRGWEIAGKQECLPKVRNNDECSYEGGKNDRAQFQMQRMQEIFRL